MFDEWKKWRDGMDTRVGTMEKEIVRIDQRCYDRHINGKSMGTAGE